MTITQRALFQGMTDELVNQGYMPPFASDAVAFSVFDKLAELEQLPPILTAPLPLSKAASIADGLIVASKDMESNGYGPSTSRIETIKIAMTADPIARANYVAEHLMKRAEIEASSVTPVGPNTPTDHPANLTRLDNKNRPPGMYENMPNRTSLPEPGIIGREVTAAEKSAGLGEFLSSLRKRMGDAGSRISGTASRLRDGIAQSRPGLFAQGLRHPHPEAADAVTLAKSQRGLDPGPNPLFTPEDLDLMQYAGGGSALRHNINERASQAGAGVRAAGSALATSPIAHMRAIRSGEGRGAAAAALAGQTALAGGAASGLGYGALQGYRHFRGPSGEAAPEGAPPPEAMLNPEMLAELASKQASEKLANQRTLARDFLFALRNQTGMDITENAKIAALGLTLCGNAGLRAMEEVLGRAKTAADADGELDDVLQVLEQNGVPVTPELLQALEAELAGGAPMEGMNAPSAPPEEKAASFRERLRKVAGNSLLTPPENTPTNQPGPLTQLDNKNRPPGKYENKGPSTELSTAEGEIGAEKKAQFLTMAQQYGAKLPATATPTARAEMIQKLAALNTDAERTAYIRSLFPAG